jgi:hypothetical protein
MTAVTDGAVARVSHSPTNNAPLTMKDVVTSVAGGIRRERRPCRATSRIEQSDVAMSIVGRAVKPSEVRKSASRVALPLTNCAVKAAAHREAVIRERVILVICGWTPLGGNGRSAPSGSVS